MRTIVCDTREQKWNHVQAGFDRLGVPWIRSKLYAGDYCYLDSMQVCVDRKKGLAEVYSNLIQQHERFRAECQRAKDAGIKLVILVEEPSIGSLDDVKNWQNPRRKRWEAIERAMMSGRIKVARTSRQPPVSSLTLETIMRKMAEKYGISWEFCAPEQTAKRIMQILDSTEK